jgi:alpha-1,3-rhamnosyltransferase
MELVSILMITYNSEEYLIEALESIKAQTYRNIELIISDDTSNDNTIEISRKWILKNKHRFSRVKLLAGTRNVGIVLNVNRACRAAQGKYLYTCAGDDILRKDAVEKKVKYSRQYPDSIIVSNVNIFGDQKSQMKVEAMNRFWNRGIKILTQENRSKQYQELLKENYIPGPAAAFYRTDTIRNMGYFDKRFNFIEDWPMLIKLVGKGYKLQFVNEILADYRMTSQSVCSSNNEKFEKSCNDFFWKVRLWLLLKENMFTEIIQELKK